MSGGWLAIDAVTTTWTHTLARVEITKPWPKQPLPSLSLDIAGEVVGAFACPAAVRVAVHDGPRLRQPAVCSTDAFGQCHLQLGAVISVVDLPAHFTVTVEIETSDGGLHPVCQIRGRRRPRLAPAQIRLNPLMVVSLGRSGSTWLMHALNQHPALVCDPTYPFEERHGQLNAKAATAAMRSGAYRRMGRSLAATEELYQANAAVTDKRAVQFFIEKAPCSLAVLQRMERWYGAGKVIVLVRDFRDVLASVFAFNAKRGSLDFGRDTVASDADYVAYLARQADALVTLSASLGARAITVRYEALMTTPEAALNQICAALEMAPFADWAATAGPEAASLMHFHRTSPSVDDSMGRWRRDLDPELQALATAALGPALAAFGYEERG